MTHPLLGFQPDIDPDPELARHGWADPDCAPLGPPVPAWPVPPAAEALARRVAHAVTETLMGLRSPHQFTRWISCDGAHELAHWASRIRGRRVRLERCRLSVNDPDHVEAVLLLQIGDERSLAVSVQLSRSLGSWTCSELAVLLPGSCREVVRSRSGYVHGRA